MLVPMWSWHLVTLITDRLSCAVQDSHGAGLAGSKSNCRLCLSIIMPQQPSVLKCIIMPLVLNVAEWCHGLFLAGTVEIPVAG